MTFQLLKVIAVFLDENNLSSNLLIICSIYVFELMNIKVPTRCANTVQEPVTSINCKTQQKSVTFSFTSIKVPNHNNNNNNNKCFILSCYSFHEFDLRVFSYTTKKQLLFSLVKKELVPCEFNLTVQ